MAVTGFNQLLQTMANADFFTGILPFLLTYLVTYLALQRVPLFQKDDELVENADRFVALISIIIAFFVANFLVQNPVYQSFFSEYLGRLAIGLVGILGFMVLIGLIGWNMDKIRKPLMGTIIVVFAVAAFGLSGGLFAFLPQSQLPLLGMTIRETFNFVFESGLIWLLVIGAALFWVTGDSDSDSDMGRFFAPVIPQNNSGDSGEKT